MKRLLAALAVLVVAGVAIQRLADATMTRHSRVDPDSHLVVVVEADAKEYDLATTAEMAAGLAQLCQLEVRGDLVEGTFVRLRPDLYRFVLRPAPDAADRRQLRGCLEDARVDKLQLEVRRMDVGGASEEL